MSKNTKDYYCKALCYRVRGQGEDSLRKFNCESFIQRQAIHIYLELRKVH